MQFADGNDQVVEKATVPCCNGALVTLERNAILFHPRNAPFLRRDLGMLPHALAGGAIGDGGDVQLDITDLQIRDVGNPLPYGSCLLKLAEPVRETLAQPQLDSAHALDPANECEGAIDAIDHAGC